MQGLLNQAQAQGAPAPAPSAPPSAAPQPGAAPDMNGPASQESRDRMDKLQGLALAGKKLLYGDETNGKLLDGLDPANPAESAAQLAATVMMLLVQHKKEASPPDLIVPAGLVLVGEGLDVLEKTAQIEVTEEMSETAVGRFVNLMLETFNPEPSNGPPTVTEPDMAAPQPGAPAPAQPAPAPGLLGGM